MLWFWMLAALAMPAWAQPVLYATGSFNPDYVVGSKLPPSGFFARQSDGSWRHIGYNHPFLTGIAKTADGQFLLTGGNGLIKTDGATWRILTGSDITEVRDVDVVPGAIYYSYCHGIRVSRDGGATWTELAENLRRRYTEAIRATNDIILAGTEQGIMRSQDQGKTWQLAGAAGYQVLRIQQSPHNPCRWLAGTEGGGLFESTDCGRSFEAAGRVAVGRNIYDLAFDPTSERIAIAAWGEGVVLSKDGGKTWSRNNLKPEITAVVFDPVNKGRLYAAVHDDGVYVSDDDGRTWQRAGLDGGHIQRLRFLPGGSK